MERAEREAIMRQGVVRPQTPRERRELAGLEEDLRSMPLRGKRAPLRLRNFMPSADAYLAATRGPRPYMLRLRELETEGVVARRVIPETPVRVEYELTAKGRELEDTVLALAKWAEKWVDAPPVEANAPARSGS